MVKQLRKFILIYCYFFILFTTVVVVVVIIIIYNFITAKLEMSALLEKAQCMTLFMKTK
jgi:hypothetical protein